MLIEVFTVYAENSQNSAFFLTEEEALAQTIFSPSEGPYKEKVEFTESELAEFLEKRIMY